jgi:hypothetical protein
MSGGVRNVTFRDSSLGGQRGIDIKPSVGRGGYIVDVAFENVYAGTGGIHMGVGACGQLVLVSAWLFVQAAVCVHMRASRFGWEAAGEFGQVHARLVYVWRPVIAGDGARCFAECALLLLRPRWFRTAALSGSPACLPLFLCAVWETMAAPKTTAQATTGFHSSQATISCRCVRECGHVVALHNHHHHHDHLEDNHSSSSSSSSSNDNRDNTRRVHPHHLPPCAQCTQVVSNLRFDNVTGPGGCSIDCSRVNGSKCHNMTFADGHPRSCSPPETPAPPLEGMRYACVVVGGRLLLGAAYAPWAPRPSHASR